MDLIIFFELFHTIRNVACNYLTKRSELFTKTTLSREFKSVFLKEFTFAKRNMILRY